MSSVNLLNEVRKTYQEQSENGTYELVNMFKTIPLLVIDDLGVEKATEWSEEMMTQIFDERLSNKRPTIITSNYSIQELSKKYVAGRVGSRIEKMVFPVPMPEESVRSIVAQQENEELVRLFFGNR
ncbi:ATP-binding protein [Priestia flexa]|uniref:ATP-binding protein n=1 Tax=Priestia flexa TaxID=86664 RepID=UPI00296FA7F5|nr:ATP-binding protein [Priestia flexa]